MELAERAGRKATAVLTDFERLHCKNEGSEPLGKRAPLEYFEVMRQLWLAHGLGGRFYADLVAWGESAQVARPAWGLLAAGIGDAESTRKALGAMFRLYRAESPEAAAALVSSDPDEHQRLLPWIDKAKIKPTPMLRVIGTGEGPNDLWDAASDEDRPAFKPTIDAVDRAVVMFNTVHPIPLADRTPPFPPGVADPPDAFCSETMYPETEDD